MMCSKVRNADSCCELHLQKEAASWLVGMRPARKCQYTPHNQRRAPQKSQHAAACATAGFAMAHRAKSQHTTQKSLCCELALKLLETGADVAGSRQHVCTAQEQSKKCWTMGLLGARGDPEGGTSPHYNQDPDAQTRSPTSHLMLLVMVMLMITIFPVTILTTVLG